MHILSIDRNKSPLQISGKVSGGVCEDSRNFRAPIYWAHRAVVFAIARLSCCKCVDFVNNPLLNCFCVSFHSVCSVTVYKRLCCSHVRAGKLRPTKNILYTILPVTTFLLIITYIVTLLQLHIAYLYQIAPCRSQLLVFFQKFQRSAVWPLDWTKKYRRDPRLV